MNVAEHTATITPMVFAAWASVAVVLLLAGLGAMWKLATMLATLKAEVQREFNHNGGASMKDWTRKSSEDAQAAKTAAEFANERAMRLEDLVETVDRRLENHTHRVAEKNGHFEKILEQYSKDLRHQREQHEQLRIFLSAYVAARREQEAAWYEAAKSIPGFKPPVPIVIQPMPGDDDADH